MDDAKPPPSVAKISGKTTPFGFTIQLFTEIKRNSFLTAFHEGRNYLLIVQSLWNDENGRFARVRVVGKVPTTPFPIDTKILLATPDQIREGLGLNIDENKALHIGKILFTDVDAYVSVEKLGRMFITGKSGSGKSYTAGVIIEELMKKEIPLVIIDRHGEFSTLKYLDKDNIPDSEPFFNKNDPNFSHAQHVIEFGDDEINPYVDLPIDYLIASEVSDLINKGNVILVNLSGINPVDQENYVNVLGQNLYNAAVKHQIPPHYLIIDEAHLFAGKTGKGCRDTLKLIAQEGRKFGSNLIIITQKPQALDTTIRAQAGTWIIHKLTDVNDVKITLNSAEGLSNDSFDEIQNLNPGEAIITGEITPYCPLLVKIRKRYTIHGGSGYNILETIKNLPPIPKSKVVERILNSLSSDVAGDLAKSKILDRSLSPEKIQEKLDVLTKENIELKNKIKELEEQLKMNELNAQTTFISHTSSDSGQTQKLSNPSGTMVPSSSNVEDKDKDKEIADLKAEMDKLKDKIEELNMELQAKELEKSGILVELNEYKDKFKEEKARADKAIEVAEKATEKLKKMLKKK